MYKTDLQFRRFNSDATGNFKVMKPSLIFKSLLKRQGYSEKAVKEIWKWYDFSDKKGVASF